MNVHDGKDRICAEHPDHLDVDDLGDRRSVPCQETETDPLIILSLQITDAVERFSLPSNDSEEAPESHGCNAHAVPGTAANMADRQKPAHASPPPPAGRSHNCYRRELKVHRMTASHVQVTEARGLGSI